MTLANLIWLSVGIGGGLLLSQLFSRGPRRVAGARPQPAIAAPSVPNSSVAPPTIQSPPSQTLETDPSDELQRLRSQVAATELAYRMAAQMSQSKGSFLARTSHELRSPLNGMIGMHQLILANLCDSPEEEREFITEANTSVLRMLQTLDDVIDASKVEHGLVQLELQPVDVEGLFVDVRTLTHLQAQNRNVRLTFAPVPSEAYVLADLRRLRQGLVSLIDSAIAVMDDGTITLSLQAANPATSVRQIWLETTLAPEQWLAEFPVTRMQPVDTFAMPPDKATVTQWLHQPLPTPGYALQLARSLLRSMQGDLTLGDLTQGDPTLTDPTLTDPRTLEPGIPRSRISCTIPSVNPNASIH